MYEFVVEKRNDIPAPLSRQIGLHAKDLLRRLGRGAEVPVLRARHPPLARVLQRALHLVLTLQLLELALAVLVHRRVHNLDLHVRHGANAELANHLRWDDSLSAGGGEGAFDAVHAEGGVPPAGHEGAFLVREDGCLRAEGLVQVVHGEGDATVEILLVVRQGRDHLLDARDLDLAVGIDQASKHAHQVGHGLLRRAAEDAAVQVLARAADGEAVVVATPQSVCEAGLLGAEPVVIADADRVGGFEEAALLGFLLDEFVQPFAAVLFHAFEAHEQVDGKIDARRFVCLDHVQPPQNRPLVICAPATIHPALVID